MSDSYFTITGDWFTPTDLCRGPWDPESCHAGPPTGILARALEQAIAISDPGKRLVRMVADLSRPVPMAGFRTETEVVRAGRSVTTVKAALIDGDGREIVTANGLALRRTDGPPIPTTPSPVREFSQSRPGEFPITKGRHDKPGFSVSTTVRYPPDETAEPGPTTLWMKTVPLVMGEEPSPFQRVCPIADCGNAFSRNAEPWEVGFINPDLIIVLDREPVGAWMGSSSYSRWHGDGTGVAYATLFDQSGEVGTATQTLIITHT